MDNGNSIRKSTRISARLPSQTIDAKSDSVNVADEGKKRGRGRQRTEKLPLSPSKSNIGKQFKQNFADVQARFAQASQHLHPSAIPDNLPCREKEFTAIREFVLNHFQQQTGGSMYISGVPGTGKTATVRQVILDLQRSGKGKPKVNFKFIEVNALKLTAPMQFYSEMLYQLTGRKVSSKQYASNALEEIFSQPKAKNPFIVMLVDELDLLCTRRQTILYDLSDWPLRPRSRLIVISIANAFDLPERVMKNRVISRIGFTRVPFKPYGVAELETILLARISKLNCFDTDGVKLIARKVASVSGDARRLLDISRCALDICEQEQERYIKQQCLPEEGMKNEEEDNESVTEFPMSVNIKHVSAALKEIFSNVKLAAIQDASEQEKIFLQSILHDFRLTGLEETDFEHVWLHHMTICQTDNLYVPCSDEMLMIAKNLHDMRIILMDKNKVELERKIRLNVSPDDVNLALKLSND